MARISSFPEIGKWGKILVSGVAPMGCGLTFPATGISRQWALDRLGCVYEGDIFDRSEWKRLSWASLSSRMEMRMALRGRPEMIECDGHGWPARQQASG
jgi:hypothetical protein